MVKGHCGLVYNCDPFPPPFSPLCARVATEYYYTGDPAWPQEGDLRMRYSYVPPTSVAVLARQDGTKLSPYSTNIYVRLAPGGLSVAIYGALPTPARDARNRSRRVCTRMAPWV